MDEISEIALLVKVLILYYIMGSNPTRGIWENEQIPATSQTLG